MESLNKTIESGSFHAIATSTMLTVTVINSFVPYRLIFSPILDKLRSAIHTDHTIIIEESEFRHSTNHLFVACTTYLSSILSSSSSNTNRFRATKTKDAASITLSLQDGEQLLDVYDGIPFRWRLLRRRSHSGGLTNGRPRCAPRTTRILELNFNKKHKNVAVDSYLTYVVELSNRIRSTERFLKLYTNKGHNWLPCTSRLRHPATFETLAMDADLKQRVIDDLARFSKREEWYNQKGKPWTRSYLIYGPSGTGKTSLVAAMAKYLSFDVYDLNIKELRWNSCLKQMLLRLSNRSMLVVEDIDSVPNRVGGDDEFSLSGLLSFVDGMRSSSGKGRVVVFTSRDIRRVDSILLQPGRVDFIVPMGFCGPLGFRILAMNYHGVDQHWRFGEIDELMDEVKVTPAEVAEELLRSEDVNVALNELVEFLRRKDNEEAVNEGRDFPGETKRVDRSPGGYSGRSRGGLRGGRMRVVSGRGRRGRRGRVVI